MPTQVNTKQLAEFVLHFRDIQPLGSASPSELETGGIFLVTDSNGTPQDLLPQLFIRFEFKMYRPSFGRWRIHGVAPTCCRTCSPFRREGNSHGICSNRGSRPPFRANRIYISATSGKRARFPLIHVTPSPSRISSRAPAGEQLPPSSYLAPQSCAWWEDHARCGNCAKREFAYGTRPCGEVRRILPSMIFILFYATSSPAGLSLCSRARHAPTAIAIHHQRRLLSTGF